MTGILSTNVWKWLVLALSLAVGWPAAAETPVGSNIDSRVVVALKVDDAAAQEMLPADWTLLTLPKGPLAGSNLLMVFIDRRLLLDPEGKPRDPHHGQALALVSYGMKAGEEGARMFVTKVYETPPVVSSYGNGQAAAFTRDLALSTSTDGPRHHRESWAIEPQTGGRIDLVIDYQPGRYGWSASEARPHSATNPDFSRIYRYEQMVDLAQSTALGRDLNGTISLQSDVPELSGLFNGSETVTGVMVVPVYVRDIALP